MNVSEKLDTVVVQTDSARSDAAPKNALYVVFDFPPRRSSGVYRFAGMAKYLGRFGWNVTVLSAQPEIGDDYDPTLGRDMPDDVRVVRITSFTFHTAESWLTRLIRRREIEPSAAQPDCAEKHSSPTEQPRLLKRAVRALASLVRALVYLPDEYLPWAFVAFVAALRARQRRPFDVIYTSSPPRSVALVGLFYKMLFRTPWICEFRDPWYPDAMPWRTTVDSFLQRLFLNFADRIVVISEGNKDDLVRRHRLSPKKIAVVPNGYDEAEFKVRDDSPQLLPAGFVHLTHFGTIYPGNCGEFFAAVQELLKQEPCFRERLRINLIGPNFDAEVTRLSNNGALGGVLRTYGFIPQTRALCEMQHSDCLLLFLARPEMARLSGLGKIYWYLRAGRPVLAITPAGGCRTLVEETGAGVAANPTDRAEIRRALQYLLERSGETWPKRPQEVEQYRYDRLAARLAAVMEGAVEHA